jgi:hypothetical protein
MAAEEGLRKVPDFTTNSTRGATESFRISFKPYLDENSGEWFAASAPVSNWR